MMTAMEEILEEETLDEELSYIEKSYLRYFGIKSKTKEQGGLGCSSGEEADYTVVILNEKRTKNPRVEGSSTGAITMRKTTGRNSTENSAFGQNKKKMN
ncbi:hypothetical protein MHBO_004700 [Bonamia ostreae]|uniref:Uncharacterized protein n=1 Tax=Bonamia ostreae TaxID=126728 RepID=A0ABV2AU17_9EUKA